MKQTLLQLTQTILSDMSSDEVNSISDTAESLQVANSIRETYFNMLSRYNLPEHDQLFQLDSSLDATQPVLMFIPEGINRLEWIKYLDTSPEDTDTSQEDQFGAYSQHDVNVDLQNNAGGGLNADVSPIYRYVNIITLEKFLHIVAQMNPSIEDEVKQFDFQMNSVITGNNSTYSFYYRNDRQPQYCCILSNKFVIFDAYDSAQDSTLQSSKTMCYGWAMPMFKMEDSFIPILDDKQFPLLLNESKSLAFFELKQQPHQKAEKEINRQISALQKYKSDQSKPTDFEMLPSYGRRGWM